MDKESLLDLAIERLKAWESMPFHETLHEFNFNQFVHHQYACGTICCAAGYLSEQDPFRNINEISPRPPELVTHPSPGRRAAAIGVALGLSVRQAISVFCDGRHGPNTRLSDVIDDLEHFRDTGSLPSTT